MLKSFYARNQLASAAVRLNSGNRMGDIKCSRCASATHTDHEEMHCETCKRWLPKAQFAKAQRKNPDNAVGSRISIGFCTLTPTSTARSA
jgi:hypothetical protein